ncbi:MAG: DNA polymerase III subunit beta [Oscillospiraceae bacterium]|nr:DNA polymerase III subunit beta [Oscillospiraceae bacterium]
MKFVCEKSVLLTAITRTSWAVASKSSVPVMEGLLLDCSFGELKITGYDLSTGIKITVPADIKEDGQVVINAKILTDIVRLFPDEPITFQTDENMFATITCKNVRHEIVCLSAKDFPALPDIEKKFFLSLAQSDLKQMISQTIFAISGDISKPVLTGSLFDVEGEKLTVVSVDGVRLSFRTAKIENESEEENFSFVVPGTTLKEVEKFCADSDEEVSICVGKKHIIFTLGGSMIISRILEGDFLNYKNAVPKVNAFKVRVNRRDLITAIERVSILISERINDPIHLNFEEKKLYISCRTTLGSSQDECQLLDAAETLRIGFNHRYILEALRACPNDEVELELNTHVSPIIITPPGSNEYLHLVLPVRLKER